MLLSCAHLTMIFCRGKLAERATTFHEKLLRSVLRASRQVCILPYPAGTKPGTHLRLVFGVHGSTGGRLYQCDAMLTVHDAPYNCITEGGATRADQLPDDRAYPIVAEHGKSFACPVVAESATSQSVRAAPPGTPPQYMPPGWPLSGVPPNPTRIPPGWWAGWPVQQRPPSDWSDPVRKEARASLFVRLILAVPALPFLLVGNLVRKLSWVCLVLRSANLPNVDMQFELIYETLRNAIYRVTGEPLRFIMRPLLDCIHAIFRLIFRYLDLSNVMEAVFQVVPSAEIRCEGTQQPWFLLANLIICSSIVSLVSADILDPVRFRSAWDSLTHGWGYSGSRNQWVRNSCARYKLPMFISGSFERGFVYLLRMMVLLVSSRPFLLRFTRHCQDWDSAVITLSISYLTMPPLMFITLASFVSGVGPAPPANVSAQMHREKSPTPILHTTTPENSGTIRFVDIKTLGDARNVARHALDRISAFLCSPHVADEQRDTWDVGGIERDYWFMEPMLGSAYRARVHHRLFARGGLLRRAWRAGGPGYCSRLVAWKMVQFCKITFGFWDEAALLAARVVPRAATLVPHRLEMPDAPVGLQTHQDVISTSGKMITFWIFFPYGPLVTRLSEALTQHLFVSPKDSSPKQPVRGGKTGIRIGGARLGSRTFPLMTARLLSSTRAKEIGVPYWDLNFYSTPLKLP